MLKNNLKILMATRNINKISELMSIVKLSRNAINKIYHSENLETVNLETLIVLCDSLKIRLSDLIEYIPESLEGLTDEEMKIWNSEKFQRSSMQTKRYDEEMKVAECESVYGANKHSKETSNQ